MKVLKFGGSSIGKPENLPTIFNIIAREVQSEKAVITVFSAFNNVTDQLKEISQLAASKDKTYQNILDDLARKHFNFIEKLIPQDKQKTLNTEI